MLSNAYLDELYDMFAFGMCGVFPEDHMFLPDVYSGQQNGVTALSSLQPDMLCMQETVADR